MATGLRFRNALAEAAEVAETSPTVLGWSSSPTDLAIQRARHQAAASLGGDKELFSAWITTMNTKFSSAINGTNYYNVDAGLAAMAAADFVVLDPEHASWDAAGLSWSTKTAINTRAKCAAIADALIRLSTKHRTLETSNTCIDYLYLGAASDAATEGSAGEPTHIWYGTPVMTTFPVFYVWERIKDYLTPEVSAVYEAAMLAYVDSLAPLALHSYPNFSGHTTVTENHAAGCARQLCVYATRVLLGTGIASAAQEALIETAIENCYINRTGLEYLNLYISSAGIGSPGMNEAGVVGIGYTNDNASGASRMALALQQHQAWRNAGFMDAWLQNIPETVMQGVYAGENLTRGRWAIQYGELGDGIHTLSDSAMWMWFVAATMSRYGLTTQAAKLKWIMQNYMATVSVGGVSIPSGMNGDNFRVGWSWVLLMGGPVFGLTSQPVTSIPTRNAPFESLIDTDQFVNPTRRTTVAFHAMTYAWGSRPDVATHGGRLDMRTRGAFVRLRFAGGDKGSFMSDSGTWKEQTTSATGWWRPSGAAWTVGEQGYSEGYQYPSDNPAMSAAQTTDAFSLVGAKYGVDADHATGFYCGYHKFANPTAVTMCQEMVFTRLDKDLVALFIRATPASGRVIVHRWMSSVHLDFHDGTETIPDHWLAGQGSIPAGTKAKGAWLSSDATTFVGELVRDPFVATHGSRAYSFESADARWFATVITAADEQDFRLEYRGFDASYTPAAIRNNLESQLGNSQYGRARGSAWQGYAAAHTNGASSLVLQLTDNPPSLSNVVSIIIAPQGGATTPVLKRGTYQYNGGTGQTFTCTSGALNIPAGTPYNYDLVDTDTAIAELWTDKSGDGADVRTVAGDGTARVIGLTTGAKVEWAVIFKLGAASDDDFTAPPTYTRIIGTNCWAVHASPENIAWVVARAHVSSSGTSDWLTSLAFRLPTLETTEVHVVDLKPGTYDIDGEVDSGGMAVTVTADGGGAFVVGSSGRLVLAVSHSGGVVSVALAPDGVE